LSSSPSFWLKRERHDDADADSAANDYLSTLSFAVGERMRFSEGRAASGSEWRETG
jgi:hypothetical protein